MFSVRQRLLRASFACVLGGLCAACASRPASIYMPLDPVFRNELSQSGAIPVLLFPDDPVEAVYDQSQAVPNVQSQGGLVDVGLTYAFNAGIDAVNSKVTAERKQAAYQTALPVIEQLSSFDLKSDIASALASETKNVRWLRLTAPVAISQKTIHDKERESLKTFDNYPAFLASLMPPGRSEPFYLTLDFKQTIQTDYTLQLRYQLFSKKDGVLIFRNQATFVCTGGGSAQDWANWWAANRGQRIRAAYTKGVRTVAAAVALDLNAGNAADDKTNIARSDAGQLTARCPAEWWK